MLLIIQLDWESHMGSYDRDVQMEEVREHSMLLVLTLEEKTLSCRI